MTRTIRSEAIKLSSVRSTYALIAAAAVFGALASTVLTSAVAEGQWVAMPVHPFLPLFTILLGVAAFVVGARAITDEFRYGTITPTALVTPVRRRIVAAKAIVAPVGGALLAGIGLSVAGILVLRWSGAHPGRVVMSAADVLSVVGWMAVVGALLAVIGVGVGAVTRHQLPTIVGGLLWFVVVEGTLSSMIPETAEWLPGRAAEALVAPGTSEVFGGRPEALVLLIGYALAATVAGMIAMHRRDLA